MIRYKGKGEHSVQGLEHIIECQNEELHQLKTEHSKCLNRLREQYKERKKAKSWSDDRIQEYNAMRLFCLDCELLTFNDIELMEHEVNQSLL